MVPAIGTSFLVKDRLKRLINGSKNLEKSSLLLKLPKNCEKCEREVIGGCSFLYVCISGFLRATNEEIFNKIV